MRAGSFLENYARGLGYAAATGRFDTFLTPTDRPVPVMSAARRDNFVVIGHEKGLMVIQHS